jgi:ParB-like chromosome segregation protein Spo0J
VSAGDHLQPQQFHPDDIGHLHSREYTGKLRDLDFAPGGPSDLRVKKIMESARSEGIHEPLIVSRATIPAQLHDGHHRYVAARRLGIHIPVRET